MKIQCSCGAKYAFELTPELAQNPVTFVCQLCGVDSSAAVNEMIRRELGVATDIAPAPVSAPAPIAASPPPPPPRVAVRVATPAAAPAAAVVSAPQPPVGGGRLNISRPAHTATAESPSSSPETGGPKICTKHLGLPVVHHCMVCKKAMCEKCMEMFGYVCSPYCNNRAEAAGVEIPVYAMQRSVVERRRWRRIGLVGGGIAAVLLGYVGFSIWYSWFGLVPKPVFSVRFEEIAYSGQSHLCGGNQIVFLHGETLARYDMGSKKEIWSHKLIDTNAIAILVAAEVKAIEKMREKAYMEGWENTPKPPNPDKLTKAAMRDAAASMDLYVCASNVWISEPGKLVRYDWDSGKPAQTVPMSSVGYGSGFIPKEKELMMRSENTEGQMVITHISLETGDIQNEKVGAPIKPVVVASTGKTTGSRGQTGAARNQPTAGLPTAGMPGADRGKPMDPAKVAEQVAGMSGPAKMALPATLSNARNQERLLNELDGRPQTAGARPRMPTAESFSFIPSKFGYIQVAVELLEEKIVERKAMKDPPKKSALEGTVNASSTVAVANELLNEMQRERGGDTEEVDESRYQVTVRRSEGQAPDWTGEVVGRPSVHPLKTINIVASGKGLIALDKMNKQLWQSALSHPVRRFSRGMEDDDGDSDDGNATGGMGPCVERGDRLYVADAAVLTAFELASGNVLWRVPSVGISEMFFDDKGMLYLNTTSADPESLKFSKQIDISATTGTIVMKIDPKEGKVLWANGTCGHITYLDGKFIYSIAGHGSPDEDDDDHPYGGSGITTPVFFAIRRINPSSGRQMWVYTEERAPWEIKFKDKYIHLVFKKEVEVLKFFSF